MLRLRRPDDLPRCVAALAEVHDQDGYPMRWPAQPAAWLDPPRLLTAWVADHDGEILGHLALVTGVDDSRLVSAAQRPPGQLAAVSRLFVRPAARGAQLGQQLLETATAYATEQHLGLVLDVVDEHRSAAIALYDRLGWRYVGRRSADFLTPDGVRPQLRLYLEPERLPPP